MSLSPVISIVVPSFNQGAYIADTLQSLVAQDYPRLEVIIQDGGSTDQSVAIAREYATRHPTIFQLFVEPDSGQADALNRGFARTRGDILGFLNSDDTLFPGCLQRVAQEIDPHRERYVAFGRCLYTGTGNPNVGLEHPAAFVSHFEQLAIWKRGFNTLPQPSVFWHRRVWERCGGLNAQEQHVLDYDLFCRFSVKYHFYFVDELWSTYRLHPASKSAQRTDAEVLDLSIAVSRRYWGAWWRPLHWRCAISHWLNNRRLHERARGCAREAQTAAQSRRWLRAGLKLLQVPFYSPRIARDRILNAWLAGPRLRFLVRWLTCDVGFTGRHPDGWIGPMYRTSLPMTKEPRKLTLKLKHIPRKHHRTVHCVLRINGRRAATANVKNAAEFMLVGELNAGSQPYICSVEIRTNSFFIPCDVDPSSQDTRKLSLLLLATYIQ